MRKIIEGLKEQREKAKDIFIENCLIKRASPVNFPIPDTDSYLDDVAELNEAISVLENHLMQKPCKVENVA
jgi:tRNA splicing ligase